MGFSDIIALDQGFDGISDEIRKQLKCDATYVNYIERQERDVAALARDEAHKIPDDFVYTGLEGLSNELAGKLTKSKPRTLAQAGRVEGMTPAALTLILAKIRQAEKRRAG